jgi:hypothetical protein
MPAQALDSIGGRWLMVVLGVIMAVSLTMLFRPRAPSPFSEGTGYGKGHGSESLMFGANSRSGAPRLH